MKTDEVFRKILANSELEIPDRNFEDKIMEKIHYIAVIKKQRSQNIRLSWGFLLLSAILLPTVLLIISKQFSFHLLTKLGLNLAGAGQILMPAAIIISAVIILIQIDNLLRLTFQLR